MIFLEGTELAGQGLEIPDFCHGDDDDDLFGGNGTRCS